FRDLDPASATHAGVARGLSYVEQAFVTVVVPVGRGISLDAGKFQTPVGLEDNESITNWNYSRSLLFTLAEPTYHAGARATLQPCESLAVSAFWLNGWNANVLDGNGMRGFGAALTWHPDRRIEVVADYVGGPERAPTRLSDPSLAFRSIVDGYVSYELAEHITLAGTADAGHDASGADWWGVGGYVRWGVLPWMAAIVRAEHLDDGDGFISGTRQRLDEATITLENRHEVRGIELLTRIEYRRDQSDVAVFGGGGAAPIPHQDTLTWSLLVAR
ncbi:MAG TPA: outer membrane beta-barrel protein, partial [Polyangiaceae bacterium]